jgi:hypothetical protein
MAAADRERGWRVSDRLAGALGLARSLAIYHGQPWRTRALNRHYAEFVGRATWRSTSERMWATTPAAS